MMVGCVMNKLPLPDKHARVRNVLRRGSKKQQVTRLQIVALHWRHAVPRCLLIGIPRHSDAARPDEHLCEPRAVEAKARSTSPQIRNSKEVLREFNRFGNR